MFSGFERGTFEFFMALGFNNNREFFHDSHDWYEKSVRAPLRELCMDIAPAVLEIDRDMEVRPARVISHINRDLRYSRDKSPYRDYMWLGFHRGGWDKSDCFHLYFDIGVQGGNVGAGMYGDDRAWTDALRRAILLDPDGARRVLCSQQLGGFELSGSYYKRMNIPDGLDEGLKRWYLLKSFSLNHAYTQDELMSAELVQDMAKRLGLLKDVYDFMYRIRPVREEEPVEDAFHRIAGAGAAGLNGAQGLECVSKIP